MQILHMVKPLNRKLHALQQVGGEAWRHEYSVHLGCKDLKKYKIYEPGRK